MREKYETLALKDLKAIAKIRGIKGSSSMSKEALIDAMVDLDAKENSEKAAAKEEQVPAEKAVKKAAKPKKTEKTDDKNRDSAGTDDKADKEKKTNKPKTAGKKEKTSGEESKPDGQNVTETVSKDSSEKESENKEQTTAESLSKEQSENETKKSVTKKFGKKMVVIKNDTTHAEEKEASKSANAEEKPENAGREAEAKSDEKHDEKTKTSEEATKPQEEAQNTLDSGVTAHGILEVMPEGFGFIRCDNYLPGADDVYVAPAQIRRFGLKTGDIIEGNTRIKTGNEKFSALLFLKTVNGYTPDVIAKRSNFETMTPVFPDDRISLETEGCTVAMRVMDLLSPVGKGQRGMIVSPPKAGKTTLLKEVAKSVKKNNPEIHMIILLIDERPEEVTDIKEAIEGPNVEVIYSTFDELPEHHKRVSEMVIERAKRLVESHKDVMILLDSITRLTRAYNLTVPPSGRTLSGGLDPAALHMPKRFFGAARNMREGGSLTILATALVDTGSKMDDVVYEEFKGTGNMEMVLDRKLSEKRIFPAIDIAKSGTRRDDLLLTQEEISAVNTLRKGINGLKPDESVDRILDMFSKTRTNADFIKAVNRIHLF